MPLPITPTSASHTPISHTPASCTGIAHAIITAAPDSLSAVNLNQEGASPAILLVSHADGRSQQRGKKRDAIRLVYNHADIERPAGPGRLRISLSRAMCLELVRDGARPALVDAAARTALVISTFDGAVITVLNARAA